MSLEILRYLYLGAWGTVNALCFVLAVWAICCTDLPGGRNWSVGIGILAIGIASTMAMFWVIVANYF